MNEAGDFVDEMLDGLTSAHPSLTRDGENLRVIRRTTKPAKNRVGIVSGGGSGHLPLFTGYVGEGLLDACAIGNVFEGPTVGSCMDAIRFADSGRGVLLLYGNYGGDRMNFDMASEMMAAEGVEARTVLGTDDIASADPDHSHQRRGVAGIIYAYKIAGAAAARGASLEAVADMASRAIAATRTIGVALSPCQVPGAQQPTFQIGEDEIEMGMGIHGEPGIWRAKMKNADALADEMLDRIFAERRPVRGESVSVLVNSLGATSYEELFILYRRIASRLESEGVNIVQPLVGPFVTSLEMAGASISMIFLDKNLESHLLAPAKCPFWSIP